MTDLEIIASQSMICQLTETLGQTTPSLFIIDTWTEWTQGYDMQVIQKSGAQSFCVKVLHLGVHGFIFKRNKKSLKIQTKFCV